MYIEFIYLFVICILFYVFYIKSKYNNDKDINSLYRYLKIKRSKISRKSLKFYKYNNWYEVEISENYYAHLWERYHVVVWNSSNYNKLMYAGGEFLDGLKFCERVFKFIEDIRYYPDHFESNNRVELPLNFINWRSKLVYSSDIYYKDYRDIEIIQFLKNDTVISDDEKVLVYKTYDCILYVLYDKFDCCKNNIVIITDNSESQTLLFYAKLFYMRKNFEDNMEYYKLNDLYVDEWIKDLINTMSFVRKEELFFHELWSSNSSYDSETKHVDWDKIDL